MLLNFYCYFGFEPLVVPLYLPFMSALPSDDFLCFPRENRREHVVFSFKFYVQVMSNNRRTSDADSKGAENRILLLITQLVCWMHCTLVP